MKHKMPVMVIDLLALVWIFSLSVIAIISFLENDIERAIFFACCLSYIILVIVLLQFLPFFAQKLHKKLYAGNLT